MTSVPTPSRALPRPLLRYAVELRKLVDTRSAAAVLAATLCASVLVIALQVVASHSVPLSVAELAQNSMGLATYLLPLLAILSVTSEWRHRTALVTYALDPRRSAVLLAKAAALFTAGCAVAAVTLAASYATVAAVGGLLPGGVDLLVLLGWLILGITGTALIGFGLATAVLNAPLAMTVYLVVMPLLPQLTAQLPLTTNAAPYLNVQGPLVRLMQGVLPEQPVAFVVAAALWIVAPTLAGFLRHARSDVG